MKGKFIMTVAAFIFATSASAQFVQETASKSAVSNSSSTENYSQLYFQYNPMTACGEDDDESGYNGFLVGLKWGMSVSSSDPLFIEVGGAFQYTSYSKHDNDVNMGTLSVPANLTYRWAIPNSSVTLAPYAGFTLKGHLWGKSETKYGGKKYKTDFFDDDDYEETANRIQLGWQIGVNVGIKKFHFGLGYGKDLTDFFEDQKFSTTYITFGFDI